MVYYTKESMYQLLADDGCCSWISESRHAFVVDYSERYADNAGIGEFAVILRQRADQIPLVKATSGSSDESEE